MEALVNIVDTQSPKPTRAFIHWIWWPRPEHRRQKVVAALRTDAWGGGPTPASLLGEVLWERSERRGGMIWRIERGVDPSHIYKLDRRKRRD